MNAGSDLSLVVDISEPDGPWAGLTDSASLVDKAARASWRRFDRNGAAEVSVVLTDDATIRRLNAEWRGKDQPTNVLSFPQDDTPSPGGSHHLGDIVLAAETIQREAGAMGLPLSDHISHLTVHGFLHLLGYDHQDIEDARAMEALETEILATLGIADPYRNDE